MDFKIKGIIALRAPYSAEVWTNVNSELLNILCRKISHAIITGVGNIWSNDEVNSIYLFKARS